MAADVFMAGGSWGIHSLNITLFASGCLARHQNLGPQENCVCFGYVIGSHSAFIIWQCFAITSSKEKLRNI